MDRRGGHSRLLQFNGSSPTKRGKLFECIGPASHCKMMTALRDKGSHMYDLKSVCTFPNRQSLQTVPALACKHCFRKELTELADGSGYDDSACGYYRPPAASYAAIDMGEPESTPGMHAVIPGRTSARTGGEKLRRIVSPISVRTRLLHRRNPVWTRK